MTLRAGIVVTGTEVLSGIINDKNGPWLSARLRELGVQLSHTVVVADRPEDGGCRRAGCQVSARFEAVVGIAGVMGSVLFQQHGRPPGIGSGSIDPVMVVQVAGHPAHPVPCRAGRPCGRPGGL